mgnify:CR=1 FL=1
MGYQGHQLTTNWNVIRNMQNSEVIESHFDEALDSIIKENQHGCVCEIDISDPKLVLKLLQAKMRVSENKSQYSDLLSDDIFSPKQMDVTPILFVWNGAGANIIPWWTIRFKQTVCAKYLIAKLMLFKKLNFHEKLAGSYRLLGEELKIKF